MIAVHYVMICRFFVQIFSKNAPKWSKPFDPFRSVLGISMYSYINQGFPPFLATFGWTILTPWAKTWNIRISKIDRKSTCWFWDLEVSLDFPDTLKSTGGLYWGVSTIFSHFWLNYFYAVGKNLKHQNLKNWPKINMLVLRLRSVRWFSRHS